MIGDLCVFDKAMVYCRGLLGKRQKYMWRPDNHSSYVEMRLTLLTMTRIATKRNKKNQKIMSIFCHLMKINNKAKIVKMRMIKMQIKIAGNYKT